MNKIKEYTTTWVVASYKPTKFGFYYRWYLPKIFYTWIMNDLQFIDRNGKFLYKKAGYKPKEKSIDNEQV